MKIFSLIHSKLIGKHEIRKDTSAAANINNTWLDSQREKFNDWPHGLLTIGTFGNNNLNQESEKSHHEEAQSTSHDYAQDITPEELNELQEEITKILEKQQENGMLDTQTPQSGNFSKDDDRKLQGSTSVVLDREKDIRSEKKKGSIRKKSLTFILKKMLVCRSGFVPTPSLRDPIPDKSRMEKILRAILHKKVYPRSSNAKATSKKYLEAKQIYHNSESDDEMFDVKNDGSKWVKTDSDYIVLEI